MKLFRLILQNRVSQEDHPTLIVEGNSPEHVKSLIQERYNDNYDFKRLDELDRADDFLNIFEVQNCQP